ncbi:acyltransferase family protein [Peribacillus sp. SCS-26]|uniref:acyltransferase family protein n=1 Tax=Paraperibacillus marinus TaxID=3115295 RepID=UPI003905C196
MNNRLEELDSLRGLAAITVMLNHFIMVLPILSDSNNTFVTLIKNTPLHFFWAGHEAVILFFILSGFVLSLPFLRNTNTSYTRYLFKRFCRIYIPYVVAITFAILLCSIFSREGIGNLSDWFNIAWTDEITLSGIFNHLFMIGDYKNFQYNPVIWSLIHEIRISLIFPFIMLIVLRLTWKKSLAVAVLLTLTGFAGIKVSEIYFGYINYGGSIFDSVYYSSMFVVGALLAKHLHELKIIVGKVRKWNPLLITIALLSYTYTWWFFPNNNLFHVRFVNEWVTVLGVVIFILMSLVSQKASLFLTSRICTFFGEISYSLYLWHAIVLLTIINGWYGEVRLGYLLLIAGILSILVATVSYKFIEEPSIKLGRFKYSRVYKEKKIVS